MAFKTAQILAVKEPVGLTREDGKRQDGVTLLPWATEKPLAWDVTVPDTYADSHLADTATMAGAAADKAASTKEPNTGNWSTAMSSFQLLLRQRGCGTT